MIYVWDNGGAYSDHAVYFVDGADWPEDFARLVLGVHEGHLVLTAETVTWWEGEATPLGDWLDPWDLFDLDGTPRSTSFRLLDYPDRSVAERYLQAVCDRAARRNVRKWHEVLVAGLARQHERAP